MNLSMTHRFRSGIVWALVTALFITVEALISGLCFVAFAQDKIETRFEWIAGEPRPFLAVEQQQRGRIGGQRFLVQSEQPRGVRAPFRANRETGAGQPYLLIMRIALIDGLDHGSVRVGEVRVERGGLV